MNRNEIRMKLWCDVYAHTELCPDTHSPTAAEKALVEFDKRFPAESSEPAKEHARDCKYWEWDHRYSWSPSDCTCGEPADEPKRVWMLIDANGDPCSWQKHEEYAKALMLQDDRICAYAEFQQVGPMVRRDDE